MRARTLYEQGDELAAKRFRHACGGTDDAGIGRRRGDADQDTLPGVVVTVSQHACGVCEVAGAIGAAAQRDFSECGEVLDGKKMLLRSVGLCGTVDETGAKALK